MRTILRLCFWMRDIFVAACIGCIVSLLAAMVGSAYTGFAFFSLPFALLMALPAGAIGLPITYTILAPMRLPTLMHAVASTILGGLVGALTFWILAGRGKYSGNFVFVPAVAGGMPAGLIFGLIMSCWDRRFGEWIDRPE